MAYGQTSLVNLKQTAVNAAAGMTAARGESNEDFAKTRDAIFADLKDTWEAENEVQVHPTQAAPTQAPPAPRPQASAPRNQAGGRGGSNPGSDPGSVVLNFGKFKTLTIGQVYALDGQGCADYGHGNGEKDGQSYVRWMTTNDKNPFIQDMAEKFLEGVRAQAA